MKTTNSPVIIVHLFQSKISGVTGGGGSVAFLSVRNSCHVANKERKEGKGGRDEEGDRGKGLRRVVEMKGGRKKKGMGGGEGESG